MPMNRLQAFDAYLRQNSIPIDGVSGSQPYGPETVDVQYKTSATQEQIAWAEQAKLTFDWRPRRFLSDANIASVFAGLTNGQQNAILRRLFARFLTQNEAWVREVMADHGVSIPYDEVVP